ncbi:MAG: YihY/virulence factor BrkB family protein [Chitinophagaceae bacterium]|nr:YihY/virulence factor BrkB family protein [Chitinophagaceae bacterium]
MIKLQRIIITSPPVNFVVRKSKQIVLPGFQGLPLYDVSRFFFQQMRQVGLNERAAAISFNFLMAIPPLCIFLFTLLSVIPGSKNFRGELLSLASQVTPNEDTYKLIRTVIEDFFKPGSGFFSFGLLLAIYFSSNAMLGIMRTFDKSILHIEVEKRNFLQLRWEAIKLTSLIILLIIATVIILFTQGALFRQIRSWLNMERDSLNWLVFSLRLLITCLLVFYAIAFIYRYAPSVQKKWRLYSPGSILATVLIIAFTYLFSYWVNNFASYNKVYGSIGSILILMLLVFVNSLVLLIGFELNVSINSLKSIARRREKKEEQQGS